ncbi:hypothetical protein ACFPOE_20760 [Caenimonas terrae]|uniref:Uncharacterized protein n=1 Tax=Caenimonas terrae TaxID=696074 RepID=A0ABW0NHU5_9BURK
MEQILGPVHGFYVASYAWPSMDGKRFTSYAKICRHKPSDYWGADCLFKLFGGEHHATVPAALATANLAALGQIDDLPSLECSTFGLELPHPVAQPA